MVRFHLAFRRGFPDLFPKPLSQAVRVARLELARRELQLAEVRRELGLADDEREPDAKLIFEVTDLIDSASPVALRRWFRLRLEGKLSTEDAQVLAAVKLRSRRSVSVPSKLRLSESTGVGQRRSWGCAGLTPANGEFMKPQAAFLVLSDLRPPSVRLLVAACSVIASSDSSGKNSA